MFRRKRLYVIHFEDGTQRGSAGSYIVGSYYFESKKLTQNELNSVIDEIKNSNKLKTIIIANIQEFK